jgi:hypothetical protein
MRANLRTTTTLTTLDMLKRQFEAGASQYHRLNHLLSEAPNTQDTTLLGPFPVRDCTRPEQAIATSMPCADVTFRIKKDTAEGTRTGKVLGLRAYQFHAYYISGSDIPDPTKRQYLIGYDHFKQLAERAGELLLSLPPNVLNVYPQDWNVFEQYMTTHDFKMMEPTSDLIKPRFSDVQVTYDAILPLGSSGADRWAGYLHWLAWRGGVGSGLRAERKSWRGRTTFPWFPNRSEYDKFASMLPLMQKLDFELTRTFYSVLENLFLCSALAIAAIEPQMEVGQPISRLFIDDIDSFEKVCQVAPNAVANSLKDGFLSLSEDTVQIFLEEILEVPFHRKDWAGELNDLCTANVTVNGARWPTAFLLKGPGIGKKEMSIADCGKRGDQLVRLFSTPADLYVVQYIGPIADHLVKDVEGKVAAARAAGRNAHFLIMDGQDTARLLHAYGKL